MAASKARQIGGSVLVAAVAALFLLAGVGKLTGAGAEMFAGWGYPAWFATVIGVLEVAGGLGLLIPSTSRWAVLGLSGIMLGAVYTHLVAGEGWQVLRPLLFLGMLWLVWRLR
jgi:uncharacterized membrane protein YphA (DoxX/SURF4 family)